MNFKMALFVVVTALLLGSCGQPSATEAPPETETLAAPPDVVLTLQDGQTRYELDPARSEARYLVREKLLSSIEGRVVTGRTRAVSGALLLGTEGGEAQLGRIRVGAAGLTSDSRLRDDRVRKGYLETQSYPAILFTPERVTGLPDTLNEGETYNVTIEGVLSIKDTHARTRWDAEIALQPGEITGTARTDVLMSTFGVGPISLAGLLETENAMRLELDFTAVPEGLPRPDAGAFRAQADPTVPLPIPPRRVAGAPEFFADVKPILEANCVGCHSEGQIGNAVWPLDTAEDAVRVADDLALVVEGGYMPPWPPGSRSPAFTHSRELSEAQIDTLVAWADAGAPTSGPLDTPLKVSEDAQSVSIRDDLELRPAEPYTPTGELSDDYRCFLIDPAIEGERFFTGYQVVPGNLNIVHHIILFGITEAGRTAAETKDAEDTADGWPCFGDIGLPGVESNVGVSWTPGEGAVKFPEGTGVPVNDDTLFVLQVHYNLAAGVGTDHSSARLELSEPGAALTPLVSLDLLAPVELPCPAGEGGEACTREHALDDAEQFDPEARTFNDALLILCDRRPADYARQDPRNVTSSCDWHVPIGGDAVSVYAHMHTLGQRFRIDLNPDTARARVLLDIPHWDFDWQSTYTFEEPVTLSEGDTVRITCTWDNAPSAGLGASSPLRARWAGQGTRWKPS